MLGLNMSAEVRCSRDDRVDTDDRVEWLRGMLCSDRFWCRRSCARLLCDKALSGMAGTGSSSTSASFSCWRFPDDADFRTLLLAEAKYPERWLGAGEDGEEFTEEASVRVSREACDDALERVVMLWSESSAEWVEASEEDAFLIASTSRVAMSGAL
jgi:hypothetical protein